MWAALGAIVCLHMLALPQVFPEVSLRADSDTAVMLDAVRDIGGLAGAWRWFFGDWLLGNGFYRPVSSLSIAVDYALYGESAWGFRFTNWLLMILTAQGLFVLVRAYARLVDYPYAEWLALGVAVALSLQQTGLTAWVSRGSAWWWVGAIVATVGVAARWQRPRFTQYENSSSNADSLPFQVKQGVAQFHWLPLLFAIGALFWGFDRLVETHYTRLISWVPSRTALLGTLFGVWAIYALLQGASARRWGWIVLGGALYLLALGSYEQPIMLTIVMSVLAFGMRRDWGAWGWYAFGAAAVAALLIIALRLCLLPTEPTEYQQQQRRSSLTGPLQSYLTDLAPPIGQTAYWRAVGTDLQILLVDKAGWDNILGALLYLGVLTALWRERRLLGGAFLWHALTFLPMAFLHFFEHYMYLPQMGKTLLDVGLIAWGGRSLMEFSRPRVE
ncbi:MAG: hypothetical protein KatS3mg019_2100 [Fimbriimonadales bacterium]|nr:MAG: hypothetical protein KatS3mg019_1172 [Fimbriimonadales bacterium]GIV10009.1 MAG: hypothetical protein KatS3mg019_2100 [Fimbriimonadales bacterium]